MKSTFFRLTFSRLKVLGVILGLGVVSLLSLNCSFRGSSRASSHQRERLEFMEDDLSVLSASLLELQDAYNFHLEDNHGVRREKPNKYRVLCLTEEIHKMARKRLAPREKLEHLESWLEVLYSCFNAFQARYGDHIEYYNEVVPKTVAGKYTRPAEPMSFEERIEALESAIVNFTNLVIKLEDVYDSHLEMFHK